MEVVFPGQVYITYIIEHCLDGSAGSNGAHSGFNLLAQLWTRARRKVALAGPETPAFPATRWCLLALVVVADDVRGGAASAAQLPELNAPGTGKTLPSTLASAPKGIEIRIVRQ